MKEIKDFENYAVTDDGRVWNKKFNRWIKSKLNHQGYLNYTLFKDCKSVIRLDNGRIFNSATEASLFCGYVETAVSTSIRRNSQCNGSYWQYL